MADFRLQPPANVPTLSFDDGFTRQWAKDVGPKVAEPEVQAIVAEIEENANAVFRRIALMPRAQRSNALKSLRRMMDQLQADMELPDRPADDSTIPRSANTRGGGGQPLSRASANARRRAMASPMKLEAWAGECAGPAEIAQQLEISRTTLNNWRREGSVVAFAKGKRAHVFPVEQFAEPKPLEGVAEILRFADGQDKVAWHWLKTPHHAFDGGTPLDALLAGDIEPVLKAAEYSLG